MDESALKKRLLERNAEFRNIHEEHQRHETRLAVLARKPFLTEDERLEEKNLKKRKLVLKDRMYRIMTDFKAALGQGPR
jgi:uncharacterized protein YdcH (DUF465 family)